jgi:hypothetical protein
MPMTLRTVLFAQGGYYAVTGLAPFISRRAFEAVTGPKRDWWLVQAVGAVVAPVGAGLMAAGASGRTTPEVNGIAAGCAAGLAAIDVRHAAAGHVSLIYLADAACQVAALAALARAATAGREDTGVSSSAGTVAAL